MALDTKVGTFETGTGAAASTVVVTGVGFLPKAIIFWWAGRDAPTDSNGAATHFRGVGFAVSSSDRRAVAGYSAHNSGTSRARRYHTDVSCILIINQAGVPTGILDFQSMDSDGFTLVVDDQFPGNMTVSYLALGGSSITNQATESYLASAGTGNVSYTTLGFQPTCLFQIAAFENNPPPDGNADSRTMLGFLSGSPAAENFVLLAGSNDGRATMVTEHYCLAGESGARLSSSLQTVTSRSKLNAFLSNGYQMNWIEGDNSEYIHVLALAGVDVKAGALTTLTNTATDIVVSGLGFAPAAVLFMSASSVENTPNSEASPDKMSVGAGSSASDRNVQATRDNNGTGTSEVSTGVMRDNVYLHLSSTGTVDGSMDMTSLDSDGFTCRMTDADPSGNFVPYIALGPVAVTGDPDDFSHMPLMGVGT